MELSEEELFKLAYKSQTGGSNERELEYNKRVDYWITELRRVGVTKKLLWEEYRSEFEHGFGYSHFCERINREIGRRDPYDQNESHARRKDAGGLCRQDDELD